MVWQNNFRELSKIIYQLKMRYGLAITYFEPIDQTHDPRTGEITRDYRRIFISKAILLPTGMERSFVYDLAYIAVGKNFTEGAYFDKGIKRLIIDVKDFPSGFMPDTNHHMEWGGERYEIRTIQIFADRRAYVFGIETVLNAPVA